MIIEKIPFNIYMHVRLWLATIVYVASYYSLVVPCVKPSPSIAYLKHFRCSLVHCANPGQLAFVLYSTVQQTAYNK